MAHYKVNDRCAGKEVVPYMPKKKKTVAPQSLLVVNFILTSRMQQAALHMIAAL